jgi:hypothetical protein
MRDNGFITMNNALQRAPKRSPSAAGKTLKARLTPSITSVSK